MVYHNEMSEGEIIAIYESAGGIWFFDYGGDPTAPHAELKSGFCSDGYVNSAPVLADPFTVQVLAAELAIRLRMKYICPSWVVGSAYAAITLSYELARQMGAKHGFVEKDPADPRGKRMLWKRFAIPRGAPTLQCEELITTTGTTQEVRRSVDEGNPGPVEWLSRVATAIYRPQKFDNKDNIIALVRREVKTWNPNECPLCAQGSKRLRPKQHWAELTGKK